MLLLFVGSTVETSNAKTDAVRTVASTDTSNVGRWRDTTVTSYHDFEKNEKCLPVQNVRGEIDENTDDYIIVSTSDLESDCKEDRNSVAYIASHVEKVDLLNFDGSDVSISDEEDE